MHTCHKLWTKICEIRQNFKGDLTKFCEIFLNITLELPRYSLKSLFSFKKLVKTTTVHDYVYFFIKICCKMVWKFCEIWNFYGNFLPEGPNSVRFYLTVWDMACMLMVKNDKSTKQFVQKSFSMKRKDSSHLQSGQGLHCILIIGHSIALDKSGCQVNNFLISPWKHML